jgi:hypothetical protein
LAKTSKRALSFSYWKYSEYTLLISSNYWTANLYFKARNGTYKRVPQIANQFNDGDNAGITLYYTSPGPNVTTAFKPVGFPYLCHGICGVLIVTGIPHAHRRCNKAHIGESWKANAAMFPLLHRNKLGRKPLFSLFGSQI